jgi:WD40 repeat protein
MSDTNDPLIKTISEQDVVYSVAILGTDRIVSGSDDTIKIWHTDGRLLQTLRGHGAIVRCVATLGTDRIVSGSRDSTIKIWHTDGRLLKTLEGHDGQVTSVAILGNDRIVSGSEDKTIKIWNTNGDLLNTLEGHAGPVNSVAILGTDRIVSGDGDRTIKIWNTDGTLLKTLEGHGSTVTSIAILGTDRIVSASWDRTVKIWNTDGQLLQTLGHDYSVASVAILGTDRIVSGSMGFSSIGSTIKIWNTDGTLLNTLEGHVETVFSIATLGTDRIVSGSFDKTIKIWGWRLQRTNDPLVKTISEQYPVTQEKKKYLADPITKESLCNICLDSLLGPWNKLKDGKVINMGLDRDVLDNNGNVIGNEEPDEVVIMYCCGNGFHKKCIDEQLKKTEVELNLGYRESVDKVRKCPGCNEDLSGKLDAGRPVYRHAEVVTSGKERTEVKTVTTIRFSKLKLKF